MALTRLPSFTLLSTDSYTFGNANITGNIVAGNLKTDHLFYSNGSPYVFTSNAAGSNTQIQFNDGNAFTGSANLTFDKTSKTLKVDNIEVTGNITPSANVTYDLGNSTNRFRDLYLSGNTLQIGDGAITIDGNSMVLTNPLGGSFVVDGSNAAYASLAAYVTESNQSNITQVGTLVSLDVLTSITAGNIKTDYLKYANGTDYTFFDGEYSSLANTPSLFSGSYADLTNKPTLGTAAATDSIDYATAAQGVKADSALQSADLVGYATELYVGNAIANLIDSAPGALDTLNELANALGDDANFASNLTNTLANKLNSNAFTYANITGAPLLGNIASIDIDGNASTILYGNGVFASAPATYSDSNVATFLSSYGSNTISTTGNITAGNIVGTSLSVTGETVISDIANLYIPGGSLNNVIKTDGSGNLSWTSLSFGNANISGSNTQLFFNDSNSNTLGSSANLTFNKSTNTLTTTNLVVNGTTNLGAVENITVTGGSSNTYLTTDGSGTLSWSSLPSTSVTLDVFTGNGVQTEFTLTTTPTNKNYTIAVVAGVVQPKATYSVSGTTLTFSEAPPDTAPVEITTINSGVSVSSGSGSGSGYSYQGISANTTLVAGTRYIVNTSSANLLLTLPSSATLGDEIGIIDGTGTADTHALTVYANGGNIMGNSGNLVISTSRAAFVLVYYNSTQGWLLTNV